MLAGDGRKKESDRAVMNVLRNDDDCRKAKVGENGALRLQIR